MQNDHNNYMNWELDSRVFGGAGNGGSGGHAGVPRSAEQLSQDRGRTHGDFSENARICIIMRDALRSGAHWDKLSRQRQLALDEIALKMARAVSGADEPGILEHFTDIAGYANLGKAG